MKHFLAGLFLLIFQLTKSQTNLVPNPSFEEPHVGKPSTKFCHNPAGSQVVQNWYQPTKGSTDFFNSTKSTIKRGKPVHNAHSGIGRVGLVIDYVPEVKEGSLKQYGEYITAQLTQPLKKGKKYSVTFYIVLDKRCAFAAHNIGAYFSADFPSRFGTKPLFETPQVQTSSLKILCNSKTWSAVQGTFVAGGNEQFITIGGFGNNNPISLNSLGMSYDKSNLSVFDAYYYLDDVSVYEVNDSLPKTTQLTNAHNNLVLVLDVSLSMQSGGKLKTLKHSVDSLLSSLDTNEIISVLTFDASPKIIVHALPVKQKNTIINQIDSLKAGGGTNVNMAVNKAYNLMDSFYIPGGNNKIVLITDNGFTLSNSCKKQIQTQYGNKKIGFSTLVFNDIKYRSLQKTCKKNGGHYQNINAGNIQKNLRQQVVVHTPLPDYTPAINMRKKNRLIGQIGFASLVVILIVIAYIK